jgi:uncharacterized membrane protein
MTTLLSEGVTAEVINLHKNPETYKTHSVKNLVTRAALFVCKSMFRALWHIFCYIGLLIPLNLCNFA